MSRYPKMTRAQFELIAHVLSQTRDQGEVWNAAITATALRFAHELRATNPQFDRERFLKACGVQS